MVSTGLPSLILLSGMIDDLATKKIHNYLVLGLLVGTLVSVGFVFQWAGLIQGGLGMITAFTLCMPLFLARALGGGDLKLLAVFGLATDWNTVLWVLVYSFFWGALLGFFRALLAGTAKELLKNTLSLLKKKTEKDNKNFHQIPYTVALMFGWFTYVMGVWL